MEITRLPPEPVTKRITATDADEVEAVLRASDDDVCVLAGQRDGDLHGDDVASHHLVVEVHEAWYPARAWSLGCPICRHACRFAR